MLITESYKEQNRKLHEAGGYGVSGHKWAPIVLHLIAKTGKDILDYGCGARTLERALGFPIKNYDPCIE